MDVEDDGSSCVSVLCDTPSVDERTDVETKWRLIDISCFGQVVRRYEYSIRVVIERLQYQD